MSDDDIEVVDTDQQDSGSGIAREVIMGPVSMRAGFIWAAFDGAGDEGVEPMGAEFGLWVEAGAAALKEVSPP